GGEPGNRGRGRQRQARVEGSARDSDVGVGRLEIGFGLRDVGPAPEQVGRLTGRDRRQGQGVEFAHRHRRVARSAPEQDRQRTLVGLQLLLQGRYLRLEGGDGGALLRQVEGGSGTLRHLDL